MRIFPMPRAVTSLVSGFAVLLLIAAAPAPAATSADGFIREIGSKAFASLGKDGISEDERMARFRSLLNEAFDLNRIGRFVLGVHWRRATEAQQTEFLDLFEKFVVKAYANRFDDLSDKKFTVTRSNKINDREALVLSAVEIPGKAPIKVNWQVRQQNGGFKVVDVAVEGVSMSITQRDEFNAVIRQNGGIDGLLDALRRKTGG